jgi:hypothetical protein
MLASSWLDLEVGVDIHLHLVPSPAGPVPTPIPQTYLGRPVCEGEGGDSCLLQVSRGRRQATKGKVNIMASKAFKKIMAGLEDARVFVNRRQHAGSNRLPESERTQRHRRGPDPEGDGAFSE